MVGGAALDVGRALPRASRPFLPRHACDVFYRGQECPRRRNLEATVVLYTKGRPFGDDPSLLLAHLRGVRQHKVRRRVLVHRLVVRSTSLDHAVHAERVRLLFE